MAWGGEVYLKHINWSLGFLRDWFLDPSFSPHTLHHWVPSYRHMASLTISTLMTHSSLLFRPDDPTVAARISGCLADISAWMKEHHLQVNLAKNELVFPAIPTLQHDFTIQLGSSTIIPISFSQKSWCNLCWTADLQTAHCKDCSILQVCTTQHQKDQALSDRACCTTSCPGPCHF